MAIFKKALCSGAKCGYWRVKLEVTDAGGRKTKLCPKCGAALVLDKSYTIQWSDENKKKQTRTLTGLNQKEAAGILGTKTTPLNLKKHIPLKATGNIRFDLVADEYLKADKKKLKALKRAVSCVEELKAYFGEILLSEMNYASIMAYANHRQSQLKKVRRKEWKPRVWKRNFKVPRKQPLPLPPPKNVSPATVGRELSVLKSIFTFAVKQKYLAEDDNPGKDIEVPKSRTIKRVLSKEQREKLFKELSDSIRPFFLFMSVTGWRYSEVAKLTWDALAHFASIAYVTDPKNCEVRDDEEARFLSSLAWAIINGQSRKSTHVFYNPKTNKPWGDLRGSFKRAARRAGLVYRDKSVFRPHDLRHDFASWCGKAKLPVQTIMALLGHKDPRSSARYIHLDNSHLEDACNTMEAQRDFDPQADYKKPEKEKKSSAGKGAKKQKSSTGEVVAKVEEEPLPSNVIPFGRGRRPAVDTF
jgi:integrase